MALESIDKLSENARVFHTRTEIGKEISKYFSVEDRPILTASDLIGTYGPILGRLLYNLIHYPSVVGVDLQPYALMINMTKWRLEVEEVVRKAFALLDLKDKSWMQAVEVEMTNVSGKEARMFHFMFPISKSPRTEVFFRPLGTANEVELGRVGLSTRSLVISLMKIPGIIEVGVQPYDLIVKLTKAYKWSETEESVQQVIFEAYKDLNLVFNRK